jgi:hypothetical protein
MATSVRPRSSHARASASLSESSIRMSTDSLGPAPLIQLLNAMPSTMPRSTPPTPQRLALVATLLSNYLTEMGLPHAFLGRFALSLRGAPYNPKWIDIEISRPTLGGTAKVKETLSAHPDFSVHTSLDSPHDTLSRLLVSHKVGVYLRVSIGCVS